MLQENLHDYYWLQYQKTKELPPPCPRAFGGNECNYCGWLDYCKNLYNSDYVIYLSPKFDYDIDNKFTEFEFYEKKVITNINHYGNFFKIFFNKNDSFEDILLKSNKTDLLLNYKNLFEICYLCTTSINKNTSGYTIRTANILENFSKYKNIICFVKPDKKEKNNNCEIFYYNNIIYVYLNTCFYENALIEFIKNSSIKIIWAASDNFNGLLSSKISNLLNLKCFYEVRGLWHLSRKSQEGDNYDKKQFILYENKEKLSCQNNNYVICENNFLKNYCINNFNIDPNKIRLLNNGIKFKENYIENYYDLNNKDTIIFGYIGSIVSYEGLINLANAINILKDKFNTQLLIIGGGVTNDSIITQKELSDFIEDNNLENKIKLIGQVPHDKIEYYYNLIDIICLPRINTEVCNIVAPLKPFEAMMYGKIVFCSSVDALQEIVTHNTNGIVFEKDNITDLTLKIKEILDKKYNLNNIQKNGFNYIKNKSWDQNIKDVITLCENILI